MKKGKGKFWEDRKQTLTTATFDQKGHIIILKKANRYIWGV